jgi:NitT/TauT family transport system substrate-binding protein
MVNTPTPIVDRSIVNRPMTRRIFGTGAVAAAAATLVAACTGEESPGPSEPGEPTKVRVNTGLGLFQGREAYLTVAEELGFFTEEGIEVEVLPGEGTETNLTQLAAGQVDFATIDVNAGMTEYGNGTFTDFVLTSVLHVQMLGCIMVLESSGISRPRDLAGTTMGVIPGGTNTVLFPAFAQLSGFDAESCEFVSPPPPSFGALLASGELDAIQQFVVARASIENEAGEPVRVFTYADLLPELYGSALGCSRQLLEDDPDLVRRFNRAALRGLEHAIANPQEAGELFAGSERHEGGQPAPVAAAENELLAPYVRAEDGLAFGEFDEVRLAQSAGILRSVGVLTNPVSPADLVAFDTFR